MAKEFRRGCKVNGFTTFSATPQLEVVKLIISMVATAQQDRAARFGGEEHESSPEIVLVHMDISRAYFHAPSKEEKHVGLLPEMWSNGTPEYGRLRLSVYDTRVAPLNWEDAFT